MNEKDLREEAERIVQRSMIYYDPEEPDATDNPDVTISAIVALAKKWGESERIERWRPFIHRGTEPTFKECIEHGLRELLKEDRISLLEDELRKLKLPEEPKE